MTTNGRIQQQQLKKIGAALVIAAGAVLTVLSILGVVGILGDEADNGFGWPVYAVLAVASLALMRAGIRNWQKAQ